MIILGLCGYGGVGKDAVGKILCDHYGFIRLAKGDLIKHAAILIDPLVRVSHDCEYPYAVERLSAVATRYDWDQAKKFPDVRLLLQNLADMTVETVGFDFWTDALWQQIERARSEGFTRIVLTRMSTESEIQRLWANNGGYDQDESLGSENVLVRIIRPGCGPLNNHPNEIAIDDIEPDYTIVNDGTIFDLMSQVKTLAHDLGLSAID